MAEPRFEPAQEGLGQRDFGEQDERLPARAQGRRNGFEINFGFAGARYAVEQCRRERLGLNIGNQRCCCRLLCVRQRRRREIGTGQRIGRIDSHFDGFDRTDLDQPADHRIGDIGDKRQFAHQPLPLADPLERLRALRGEADLVLLRKQELC